MEPASSSHSGADSLLATLVRLADRGISVEITILLNGVWLTGTITSGNTYLKEFGNVLAGALERTLDEPIDNLRPLLHRMADAEFPTEGDLDSDDAPRPAYLHLRDVQRADIEGLRELPIAYKEFPYWRCRLSSIDAWTLGRVELGAG